MKALILDTTSQRLYAILSQDGKIIDTQKIVGYQHSRMLNVAVQNLLDKAKMSLADIDVFGVAVGVGSFTGIRVGIATIKGYLTVFPEKKAVSFNSLQTLAYIKEGATDCLADAGRNLFYYAKYDRQNEIIAPTLCEKERAEKLISDGAIVFDDRDLTEEINLVVWDKINNGNYAEKLTPIYLRQPQAVEELQKRDKEN